MDLKDAKSEYDQNKDLKKPDVEAFLQWANKQQHLPKITEKEAILFLHSCYFNNEAAKTTIDTYYTMRTLCPDFFKRQNPTLPPLKTNIDNSLGAVLPKKTPEGHTIILLKLMDTNPQNFNFIEHIKYFDMVCMLHLYKEGTSEGHVIVVDMKGALFGHLTRAAMAGPIVLKKFLFYVQEAMPLRLKGIHFVNIVPFMDKVLAMIKPFIKMEILDLLKLHNTVDDLAEFIPLDCLPEDFGGSVGTTATLHELIKSRLLENTDFFDWLELQVVDENKRLQKFDKFDDVFGIDGTFKKLEID